MSKHDELFEIGVTKSPKLLAKEQEAKRREIWLKSYGFSIHYNKEDVEDPYECVWGDYDAMVENIAEYGEQSCCLHTGATALEAMNRAKEFFNLPDW